MSPSEGDKVFGLFANGKAEWFRWSIAMFIGAAVTYATMERRIAVLESRLDANDTSFIRAIDNLTIEIRDIRAAVYTRQPLTIIEDAPPLPRVARPVDDGYPKFSAPDNLRATRP